MKKYLLTLICLLSLSTLSAQSWKDALKDIATQVVDKATDGKATQYALIGEWSYAEPAIRLEGESALSNVGGSAISSMLVPKMKTMFEKIGLKEGVCSIAFDNEGKFTMPTKYKKIEGTYSYNNEDHSITLNVDGRQCIGYAYISGTKLELVFNVDKLLSLFKSICSSVSQLKSLGNLLESYDKIYMGMAYNKK